MRKYFIVFILLISTYNYGQNIFPDGVYLNVEQLQKHSPAFNTNFELQSKYEISGIDLYELVSSNDSLDEKFIRKKIFAYIRNDSIFINSLNYRAANFVLAITKGNFIVFPGKNDGMAGRITLSATRVYSSGSTILYILSLRTGSIVPLTIGYVKDVLKEFPELRKEYSKEKNKVAAALHYLNQLNAQIPVKR